MWKRAKHVDHEYHTQSDIDDDGRDNAEVTNDKLGYTTSHGALISFSYVNVQLQRQTTYRTQVQAKIYS